MRRLLWKELRERRLMLLALVASTSGLIVCGNYHVMLNSMDSGWIGLSVFAALCLGAGTYSSELAGGAADFARSRPISWKSMFAAKLTVGLGFVLAATLLMALVFRLVCPAQYLSFANPIDLAPSLALALVLMGLAYLFGFVCSVALPSTMGSVAVVVLVFLSFLLEVACYQQLNRPEMPPWSLYFRFVGAGVAVVLISRFGLTLPTGWRMMRFCAIVLVFAIAGIPMNFTVRDPLTGRSRDLDWSLSPTGNYAAVTRLEPFGDGGKSQVRTYLVRAADGRKAELDRNTSQPSFSWYKDTIAAFVGDAIRVTRMDSSGRLRGTSIPTTRSGREAGRLRQSPDGRYILYAPQDSRGVGTQLTIADLDKMSELHIAAGPQVHAYWWQSNSVIGYMDRVGRHTASVPE